MIMDGWKRFLTFAWPSGILQRIRETEEEINLYIFNSSGDWNLDENYNAGEYNIYRLPDLKDFDGIILDLNNVRYSNVREYAIEAARKSGRPVISISNEIEGFYYVGIDNYTAMRRMIEHLHQIHGCRSFWFVMGPADNYENNVRVKALKDYLGENQLSYSEDDFYFESYEFYCGYNGFHVLYEQHGGRMPDAVVCANDNIAVGVCEAAAKEGYTAPGDFLVTGFDDFDKARYYVPRITTVSHIREKVGYVCVELFLALWNGKTVDRFNYTDTTPVFSESCGCRPKINFDERMHDRDQIMYGIETTEFEDQVLSLEYELMHCKTVKEMTDWIPKCIPAMNCDAMYLVVDEHINDFRRHSEDYDRRLLEEEEFHVEGYPEEMLVEFAYEDGKNVTAANQKVRSLFPMFEYGEGGKDFLFMPLHFSNHTVGYFVIRNAVYLMEKQYLFKVLNALTSAMENLHKKEKLEFMNQVLSDLYVRDPMTGLYNRLGYRKLGGELFNEKKRRGEQLQIMFLDLDRLKYINDTYGHEYGDAAIKTIANAILKYCPKTSVPVRNGGDEFLIIQERMDEGSLQSLIENIRNEIREKSPDCRLPFPLTVSIGCICTDAESEKDLDDYVREADEIMYLEKASKKVNRS